MVGQFHPTCTEPAARNTTFMVNRAPVPLVAIRRMALHDVLFLHQWEDWFLEYSNRFGHRYGEDKHIDPALARAYSRGVANFGL
jgi:hypothetical protein